MSAQHVHHEFHTTYSPREARASELVTDSVPAGAFFGDRDDRAFVDRARRVISRQILDGGVSVQNIARELGTSGRTLQRRLQNQGTSLQALLAAVRCELAVELLTAAHRPASEVAEVLGFSAPSAFHRAFKRWTGHTPGEYRRKGGDFSLDAS